MRYDFIYIDDFLLLIMIFLLNLSFLSNTFSYSASRGLSQHTLKFWTVIRQKIRCEMVLVSIDS